MIRFQATPNSPASRVVLVEWARQLHNDGFIVIEDLLSQSQCDALISDLDLSLSAGSESRTGNIELHHRMFESSPANLALFDFEPIVGFAESVIDPNCHVIHNNSFAVKSGKPGISNWHQDDPPHYIVTEGDPPTNVHLPILFFTCNYYLTDVDELANGPTQFIPGSHLFGKPCPPDLSGTPYEKQIATCTGKAGTAIIFNNQVWHRGTPNTSDRTRYITQLTYARRIIGHKYFPFMNYQMPAEVYSDVTPRLRRLLGFLPTGNYG